MFAALYKIIIYPIYQLIELIYYLLNSISNNTVFSILGISVSITLLCLPLYNIAEKWQAEERNIQKN